MIVTILKKIKNLYILLTDSDAFKKTSEGKKKSRDLTNLEKRNTNILKILNQRGFDGKDTCRANGPHKTNRKTVLQNQMVNVTFKLIYGNLHFHNKKKKNVLMKNGVVVRSTFFSPLFVQLQS